MSELALPSPHWENLFSSGHKLLPETLGTLRPTESSAGAEALRAALEADGYLFLPGALDRGLVTEARQIVCDRLAEEGALEPGTGALDGILRTGGPNPYFRPDFAQENAPLMRVLYTGPMLEIFGQLLGGPIRHFDFTWFRAVGRGRGTQPHCDTVYMGRGSTRLLTAWTPLGDIPVTVGGLMVLEESHCKRDLIADYLRQDVDSYCANGPNAEKVLSGKMNWEHWDGSGSEWNGALTDNPVMLQQQLGGRWLTTDYQMGDVLIFTMGTVHASLDNASDRIRLSTDTRYQPQADPIDERWVGENPIAHGIAGKRGKIC